MACPGIWETVPWLEHSSANLIFVSAPWLSFLACWGEPDEFAMHNCAKFLPSKTERPASINGEVWHLPLTPKAKLTGRKTSPNFWNFWAFTPSRNLLCICQSVQLASRDGEKYPRRPVERGGRHEWTDGKENILGQKDLFFSVEVWLNFILERRKNRARPELVTASERYPDEAIWWFHPRAKTYTKNIVEGCVGAYFYYFLNK